MSIPSQPVTEEGVGIDKPAHHPPAPADALFDISTTVDPSYVIFLIRKLLPQSEDKFLEDKHENMDTVDHLDHSNTHEEKDDKSNDQETHVDPTVGDDSWEEHGCILWDLATSRTHAELMVQNLVLEVILATLTVSKSPRVTEISLGIIGNLACHKISREKIASVKGLVEIIVEQLFIDDTPCLCEEFRLLTLCLQGTESITWAKSLESETVLSRILWVVENTLNPQLIEKSVGFLLTISESQDEVKAILLPHLVKLGLPVILINLLAFEISKLVEDERVPERYSILDVILRTIEALTVTDSCSQQLCSSKKLVHLLGTLIKIDDKIEVATSCVTAAVLTANLLSDSNDLILEINQDVSFLQGLLDIFPFASDDLEARNAIWDIISRLLGQFQEVETISPSNLQQYVSVLSSKSDLIEEELLDHQLAVTNKNQENSTSLGTNLHIRTTALKRIDYIVSKWIALKAEVNIEVEDVVKERDLDRLMDCCCKYSNDSVSSLVD